MAKIRSQRRVEREKFYKRGSSWTKKGDQLVKLTGADVYSLIYRNDKIYVYTSTDRPGWPPTKEEIVGRLNGVTLYAQLAEIFLNRPSTTRLRYIKAQQTFHLKTDKQRIKGRKTEPHLCPKRKIASNLRTTLWHLGVNGACSPSPSLQCCKGHQLEQDQAHVELYLKVDPFIYLCYRIELL